MNLQSSNGILVPMEWLKRGILALALLTMPGCITWISGNDANLDDSQFRAARNADEVTISFRYSNVDYSAMEQDKTIEQRYAPQLQRYMQPGMDALVSRGVFKKVEFVGINRAESGNHIEVLQEEITGAWTITNAVIAGLTLNWIPTYTNPDHRFVVNYYEDGELRKQYEYIFSFHSLNWNLFLPFWLIASNQDSNDSMYATLLLYVARDLIQDKVI